MPDAKPPVVNYGVQIATLLEGLQGIRSNSSDDRYRKIVDWLRDLPPAVRSANLYEAVGKSFSVTAEQVSKEIDAKTALVDFEDLVPRRGWLKTYVDYTRLSEPPTVFHFFVGATILGASLRRNLHYSKGTGNIYPNLCVVLVGPSGGVKKTTACEFGVGLYRSLGGIVLADKITPEALVDAFQDQLETTGLIYAGELKQFLGSQKYMEGMIPLLTRLFDCPDVWSSRTIARKELTLRSVGLSMLAASTMDWLRALPADTFGGGFMSRLLLVVQETTTRVFPRPPQPPEHLRVALMNRLVELSHVRGKFNMTPNAQDWFDAWYRRRDDKVIDDKQFAGYYNRKPDHLIRMAMILSIAEDDGHVIEIAHLEHSLKILNWTEQWLPAAFEQLNINALGEEHLRLLRQIRAAGGKIDYSTWLRKNSARMNGFQFKQHIQTMQEAKLLDFDGKLYYLTPEGWNR